MARVENRLMKGTQRRKIKVKNFFSMRDTVLFPCMEVFKRLPSL